MTLVTHWRARRLRFRAARASMCGGARNGANARLLGDGVGTTQATDHANAFSRFCVRSLRSTGRK